MAFSRGLTSTCKYNSCFGFSHLFQGTEFYRETQEDMQLHSFFFLQILLTRKIQKKKEGALLDKEGKDDSRASRTDTVTVNTTHNDVAHHFSPFHLGPAGDARERAGEDQRGSLNPQALLDQADKRDIYTWRRGSHWGHCV